MIVRARAASAGSRPAHRKEWAADARARAANASDARFVGDGRAVIEFRWHAVGCAWAAILAGRRAHPGKRPVIGAGWAADVRTWGAVDRA